VYLLAAILIPLLAAAGVAVAPRRSAQTVALLGMLLQVVVVGYAASVFDWSFARTYQLGPDAPISWFPALRVGISLGVDAVAMLLVMLTALLGPICVVASTTAITERVRTYYAWMLILQAAMTGVFCTRDIIFFYVCFEFTLVPMFILISLWGSTNRRHAAIKFFLFTFTGSVIALAGLVYTAWFNTTQTGYTGAGAWSFDIATLTTAAQKMTLHQQGWVLLALMAGFAVKVPLFPVHTWLPLAHTEAPTAGSVILAGVLLKLGTYAIFRFVLPFVPDAVVHYAPLLAVLCIIGILYGGLICWVQTDVKKLVAYSSVAHLGFCMLGMFALNNTGITGSITYMINHGLSTGALFLMIGMIYERYHTRNMKELGGLAARMPVWATFMVFFVMASVGLPGLNGFVSEFLCILGAFQASSAWGSGLWGVDAPVASATFGGLGAWYAAIAGIGMIVAAMYLLIMVGKVVWGPLVEPHGHGGHGGHGGHVEEAKDGAHAATLPADLTPREILTVLPLAVLCLALGVYPKPMLEVLQPSINVTVSTLERANANREMQPAPATPSPAAREHAAVQGVAP
jgi:NADH-quinone oxidoreductase subunit M